MSLHHLGHSLPFARPLLTLRGAPAASTLCPFPGHVYFYGVSKLPDGIFLQGFKSPLRFYPFPRPFCGLNGASMEFRSCQMAPFSTASKAPLRFYPCRTRFCHVPVLASSCQMVFLWRCEVPQYPVGRRHPGVSSLYKGIRYQPDLGKSSSDIEYMMVKFAGPSRWCVKNANEVGKWNIHALKGGSKHQSY